MSHVDTRLNYSAALVFAVFVAMGAVWSFPDLFFLATVSPIACVIGVGIALLLACIIYLVLSYSKLWQASPWWAVAAIFWGMTAPIMFAVFTGDAITEVILDLNWEAAYSSFAGAWPEETGKGVGILLIIVMARNRFNRPWDGLFLGLFVGLGFELVENIQYGFFGAIEHGNSDLLGVAGSWMNRLLIGGGLHMIFSAIVGFGLSYAISTPGLSLIKRILAALSGFGLGFGIHFAWNYESPEDIRLFLIVGLYLLGVLSVILLWRISIRLANNASQLQQPTQIIQAQADSTE